MKIGELATIARTSVETIRYYEKTGLMPKPIRTANNYRTYNQTHVDRLRFIRNCRALDLSHEEIWALLTLGENPNNCAETTQVLEEHIAHVRSKIKELHSLEERLVCLNAQCQSESENESCSILQALKNQEIGEGLTTRTPHTHNKRDFSH